MSFRILGLLQVFVPKALTAFERSVTERHESYLDLFESGDSDTPHPPDAPQRGPPHLSLGYLTNIEQEWMQHGWGLSGTTGLRLILSSR
jgi:hypothetical protein